jgi:hypothetical protein
MMSLYFTDKVEPQSGKKEAETLPPMEALVLRIMFLEETYNSVAFSNRLFSFRTFDTRECDVITETGILSLLGRGDLKPASKKAEQALQSRNDLVWGLGDIPFVVTAKGAKRVGFLVAAFTSENVKEVVTTLQMVSKEQAKGLTAQ